MGKGSEFVGGVSLAFLIIVFAGIALANLFN